MANNFKNAGIAISNTRSTLYTCPANSQSVIHALFISNINDTINASVDIEITIDGGTTYRYIGKKLPLPPQSTLILEKPINLESNDVIALTSSSNGVLEVVASILEVTPEIV